MRGVGRRGDSASEACGQGVVAALVSTPGSELVALPGRAGPPAAGEAAASEVVSAQGLWAVPTAVPALAGARALAWVAVLISAPGSESVAPARCAGYAGSAGEAIAPTRRAGEAAALVSLTVKAPAAGEAAALGAASTQGPEAAQAAAPAPVGAAVLEWARKARGADGRGGGADDACGQGVGCGLTN